MIFKLKYKRKFISKGNSYIVVVEETDRCIKQDGENTRKRKERIYNCGGYIYTEREREREI